MVTVRTTTTTTSTTTSTTQFSLINRMLLEALLLKTFNAGFILSDPYFSSSTQISVEYGYIQDGSLGTQASLNARLGIRAGTSDTYQASLRDAVDVTGVILTEPVLYADEDICGAYIKVALQVHDSSFNTKTRTTEVFLFASIDGQSVCSTTCEPDSITGICIATVFIDKPHFRDIDQDLQLSIGLNPDHLNYLGRVILHEYRPPTVRNDVLLSMPNREFFHGDSFKVDVVAQIGLAPSSFTLRFDVATGLRIAQINTHTRWNAQVVIPNSGQTAGISALLADPSSAPTGQQDAETLCTLTIFVTGDAELDEYTTLHAWVQDITDVRGQKWFSPRGTPGSANFLNSDGFGDEGTVYVSREHHMGLLPYLWQSEFVNTAMLTGIAFSTQVTILSALSSGRLAPVTRNLQCSSPTSVITISSDCLTLRLIGSETSGAERASIAFNMDNSGLPDALLSVRVWIPTEVDLTASDRELNAIEGYFDRSNSCRQRYQQATLHATATFAYPSSYPASFSAIVTNLIAPALTVSNPNVLTISSVFAKGLRTGFATVSLNVYNNHWGSIDFEVTNTAVQPVSIIAAGLQALVFGSLTNPIEQVSSHRTVIQVRRDLTIEQQRAAIVTGVYLSDDTIMELFEADGLEYHPSGNGIVGSSGSEVIAITSGVDDVLVTWNGGACNNVQLASGTARIVVNLPAPDAAYIVGLDTTLTFPDDPAAQISVGSLPMQSSFQVQLGFGSRRQGMTNDLRTIIDLSESNDLFTVEHDGSTSSFVLRPNTENRIGSGVLRVRFTHASVTVSHIINIVKTDDILQASFHYPIFPGSDSTPVNVLYQIANIGRYEQALVKSYLLISDQSTIEVTMEPSLVTVAKRADRSNFDNTALKLSDLQQMPVIVSPSRPNELHLCAELFSFTASQCHVINVVSTSVSVDSIVDFTIDGQHFVDTVRGAPSSTHYLDFTIVLSDNSRISQILNFGEPVYPGLVRLGSSESSCLSINANTGVMVLLNNCEVLVTLTATPSMGNAGSTNVWSNMDATVGDIDLGDLNGPQFPTSVQVGSYFRVPVHVNSGQNEIGAIDVTVRYDHNTFEVLDVVSGADWTSGSFLSTINDPPGRVSFGGTPQPMSGEYLEFAIIYFKAKVAFNGNQYFTGTVNTVATIDQRAIGPATPRALVAGAGYIPTGQSVSRRSLPLNADLSALVAEEDHETTHEAHDRVRRSTCSSPPCDSCSSARQTGDANGDCVFDINDVTYTQLYVLAVLLDNAPTLLSFQPRAMDPDLNGEINTADAYFLLRVNFRLLRFVTELTASVDAGCTLRVRLKALTKGDEPAPTAQTFVFVDLESPNANLYSAMQQASLTSGSTVSVSKNSGFNGGIWQMAGPSSETGVYLLTATGFYGSRVTLSLIQATTDMHGVGGDARTGPMLGSLNQPYAFPYALSVTLPLPSADVELVASNGYTGLMPLTSSCAAASTQAPTTRPATTNRVTTGGSGTTIAATTPRPGTSGPATTGRATTALATTLAPVLDRCVGKTTVASLSSCTCGTTCYECDLVDSFVRTCYTCKNANYLLNGVCVIQCPVGFRSVGTGNFFRTCVADQATTAAPAITTTAISIPPQYSNSTCTGKFITGTSISCTCAANCHTCNLLDGRAHDCVLCKNAAYLLDGACVARCPDSYISTGTGLFARTCTVPATVAPTTPTNTTTRPVELCSQRVSNVTLQTCSCTTNCHQCSLINGQESQCFVCKNRFFLLGSVCLESCPAGYVGIGTGNFFRRCVESVTTVAPTGSTPVMTDVCVGRFMSISNRTCRCQSNCYQCEFGGGLPGRCQECKNGRYRLNGACLQTCPLGYRPRGIGLFFRFCALSAIPNAVPDTCVGRRTNLTNQTCYCEADCYQCSFQGTAGVCSMCKNNRYLVDGSCLSTCPTGFNPVGSGRFGRTCNVPATRAPATATPIVTTRSLTGNGTTVDVCAGKWTTLSLQACSCPSQCYQCPISSNKNTNTCQVCKNSFLLHNGACIESCPAGFVPQGTGRFFRQCLPSVTRTCAQGVLLGLGQSCRCEVGCDTCSTRDGVSQGCSVCTDSLYLFNSTCVASCPDGTTPAGTDTTGRTCSTHSRRSLQTDNIEGLAALNDASEETVRCDGKVRSDTGDKCSCNDNCHECELLGDGQSVCLLCSNSQYLFKGSCYDACPDGMVAHGKGQFGRYCTRHGQNARRKILTVAQMDGEEEDGDEDNNTDTANVLLNTYAPMIALSMLIVGMIAFTRRGRLSRPAEGGTALLAESS